MNLDMQMSDPDFWNDPEKAKAISQEETQLKAEVEEPLPPSSGRRR